MKRKIKILFSVAVVLALISVANLALAQTFPTTPGSPTGSGGWSITSISEFGLPKGRVLKIITNILQWLLTAFGIIGLIGFLLSGILYLTAAGDDDQMKRAKKAMTFSIIGVIVGLVGYVAIQAIHTMLQGTGTF